MSAGPLDDEAREQITCPECGTTAVVIFHRRDAGDFCAVCDFPLFWTPSAVIRDHGPGSGEALRRLPGTGGRQTVASAPCPTCAEANPITAANCLRCGGPMVLAPEPELPPPAPEPVPEPAPVPPAAKPFPWWWVVGGVLTVAVLVVLLIVLLER
jgi:hypothetical protein